ncbi:MAG: LD-carboxypeptidase [Parafilimonas sp.]|nr:LD-carboxypeptidase [Parafilimonas sp.]
MSVIIPPYLKPRDTIGMICPSGYMPLEEVQRCIETLQQWGFKVVLGKTVGNQYNYFSGTDEERLNDLQLMLDDKNIQAIYCGRGGYGLSRVIDKINFSTFVQEPKWIIGYSDITLLHAHVFSNFNIASLHAPMAAAFNEIEESEEYINSIYKSLIGEPQTYTCASHYLNRNGIYEGELVGGNLSLLAHIIGTKSDINTKNKILFIEDIGEYKYNIDRMLMQLKRAGKLDELASLIVGSFSEIKDTTIPYGKDLKEMIFDSVKEYSYPVCFDFPVGHVKENYALKIGLKYELIVDTKQSALKEKVAKFL